jgi:hypothetical protein
LSIKLFWTQDILNFFEVPKELHANFEIERGRYEQKCQMKIEGRQDNKRRQSYCDMNTYLLEKEDNETGDSGSADQKSNLFSEDQLRRCVMPLSVCFLKWQQSNVGNFVEFVIRVRYQEGPKNAVDARRSKPSDMLEWDIYKRYTNFADLHESLLPYYR